MPTTAKGFPYPDGPDANDLPGDLQALAEALDAAPGVASLTQAQIDALSAPQKWAGRIVWNSTVSKHQKSDGSTFSDLDSLVGLSSSTPQALGAASAGTSGDASRADHRHAMPSPADIGAISTSALTSTNPAALGAAAAPGTSTDVARLDHVHARPTAADVGAVANSLVTAAGQVVASTGSATPAVVTAGTTNGDVLTWDSTVNTRMKWAAPAGGGVADPFFFIGV